jgi:hypothetical protein
MNENAGVGSVHAGFCFFMGGSDVTPAMNDERKIPC